jgi:MFS family permease
VLCISLLIVTLDTTVLNVVLPILVDRLGATSSQLQWVVDAYVIVFAGLLLAAGSIADRVGRKWTFMAGLLLFAGGSTWAAFSGSVSMLIAARASMGIGGALIMPSMLAHFWWGSVFLINVPIAALGLLLAIPLVPNSKNPAAAAPDIGGTLASMAGLGLLLWAIIEAPVRGWSSGLVIGAGPAGVVVLAAFAWWERVTLHPMLNLQFFRHRAFSAAISTIGLATLGLYGAPFVLTQFLQFDLGYTPLQAGVRILPAAGLLIIGGGLWQISLASAGSTFADTLPGMIMLGVGHGLGPARAHGHRVSHQRRHDAGGRRARRGDHRQPALHQLHGQDEGGAGALSRARRRDARHPGIDRRCARGSAAGRRRARPGTGRRGQVRVRQRHGSRDAGRRGRGPGRLRPGPDHAARPPRPQPQEGRGADVTTSGSATSGSATSGSATSGSATSGSATSGGPRDHPRRSAPKQPPQGDAMPVEP